jgi:hypothetical protein
MKLKNAFWTGDRWLEAGEECPTGMETKAREQGAAPEDVTPSDTLKDVAKGAADKASQRPKAKVITSEKTAGQTPVEAKSEAPKDATQDTPSEANKLPEDMGDAPEAAGARSERSTTDNRQ